MKDPVCGASKNSLTNHAVLPNGTFIHSRVVPQIGYQCWQTNWTTRTRRKRFGLKEKDFNCRRFESAETATPIAATATSATTPTGLNVETVISTSPDQIGDSSGVRWNELWTEKRPPLLSLQARPFRAELLLISVGALRDCPHRVEWRQRSRSITSKNSPGMSPKMLNSVQKSFDYYTKNFGPYPQREARIIEFPRLEPLRPRPFPAPCRTPSPSVFIANIEKPDDN